jgi:hypothetical protein
MLLSSCGFACRLLGSAEAAALAASPLARMTDVAFGSMLSKKSKIEGRRKSRKWRVLD